MFLFVSIMPLGPISWYRKPWSGSGHQFVWNTTVSGQIPLRLPAATPGAAPTGLGDGTSEAAGRTDGDAAAEGDADTAGDAAGAGELTAGAVVGLGAVVA